MLKPNFCKFNSWYKEYITAPCINYTQLH